MAGVYHTTHIEHVVMTQRQLASKAGGWASSFALDFATNRPETGDRQIMAIVDSSCYDRRPLPANSDDSLSNSK